MSCKQNPHCHYHFLLTKNGNKYDHAVVSLQNNIPYLYTIIQSHLRFGFPKETH